VPATVEERIARFLSKYDTAIQKEARAARRMLRKTMPAACELVYDNYNALVFAFASTEKRSDIILSIALYPRWVTLFFMYGTALEDPEELLEGSGKEIRGVRLTGGAKDLTKPAVRALVEQAISRARTPFAAKGRGPTIIKSESPKKRKRRPQP
jgi:hypothetical protein